MKEVKNRDINLDLIRAVALFMVPVMHSLDHTGIYDRLLSEPADWVMLVVRHLFTCCIPLYVMLSGYLCKNKKLSARYYLGLLRVLGVYLIAAVSTLIFEQLTGRADRSLYRMAADLVNFQCIDYSWYIQMYFGLFLMIPFLNLIYNGLRTQKQRLMLVATFFILSVLPSFLNSYVQLYSLWWTRLYPLCYYFLGAYLADYMPRISWKKLLVWLLSLLGAFSLYFYFHYDGQGQALTEIYQTSWQIFILAVLLFVFLYRLPLDSMPELFRRCIGFIAGLTLPAFLMSWISDSMIYPVLMAALPAGPARYPWLMLTAPLSFCLALLMAKLVMIVYSPVEKLTGKLMKKPFFAEKDPLMDEPGQN